MKYLQRGTTYTSEGTRRTSDTGTGSAATTGTTGRSVNLSDTFPGGIEKE